jgi:outer membrane biogenesis lipoprotein LolB
MKTLLLLACLLAFSAPAFASSHHNKQHYKQHHQKIRNGTPNHRRAGT